MVNVSQGTAATVFVLQGSGFAPRALVTFRLTEVGPPPDQKNLLSLTSPDQVRVGADGMFRVCCA